MTTALQSVAHLGKFERLQLVEDLWDDFAQHSDAETRPEVIEELQRRAGWRDNHPNQGKSIEQVAHVLGVSL